MLSYRHPCSHLSSKYYIGHNFHATSQKNILLNRTKSGRTFLLGVPSNNFRKRNVFWNAPMFCPFVLLWYQNVDEAVSVVQGLACWPLVPKFAGSSPVEAVGFLRAEKILSTPSFEREGKLWVPCRRFAACKSSLNVPWKSPFRQYYRSLFPPISSNFRRWSAERVGRRGSIWWPKFERPKRAVQYVSRLQYIRGLPRTPKETNNKQICRWRWGWSVGGLCSEGKTSVLEEKSVPVPLWPPQNAYGLN
jgi:hypothetical protein